MCGNRKLPREVSSALAKIQTQDLKNKTLEHFYPKYAIQNYWGHLSRLQKDYTYPFV